MLNTLNDCLVELNTKKKTIDEYICNLPKEKKNYLEENNFFLKDKNNKSVEEVYFKYRNALLNSENNFNFVIHLNYSCNLRCDYCYQNDISQKQIMTDEVEKNIIDFISSKINRYKPLNIEVSFIGGEPLLYKNKIKNIIKNLNFLSNSIDYSIVTNGTLLDEKFLKELKEIEIDHLFITLDGPEHIHNSFRKTESNEGTFQVIINNLKKAQELNVPVILNNNLNYKNHDRVEELILTLKKEKITYPLYFSDVFDCKHNKENNSYEGKILSPWGKAHKIAISYGYEYKPFYRNTFYSCGYNIKNFYNISPTGDIFSCISGMENCRYKRGNIKNELDIINFDTKIDKSCLKCPFLVRCGGGCNFKSDLKESKDCSYEQFKNEDIELLSMYIDKNF